MATGIRGTDVWKIVYDSVEYYVQDSVRQDPEQQEIDTDVLTTEYSAIENNYFGQRYRTVIFILNPTKDTWSEYKALVNKNVLFYPNKDNVLNAYSCRVTSVRPFRKSNWTRQQFLKIELESNEYIIQEAE